MPENDLHGVDWKTVGLGQRPRIGSMLPNVVIVYAGTWSSGATYGA